MAKRRRKSKSRVKLISVFVIVVIVLTIGYGVYYGGSELLKNAWTWFIMVGLVIPIMLYIQKYLKKHKL